MRAFRIALARRWTPLVFLLILVSACTSPQAIRSGDNAMQSTQKSSASVALHSLFDHAWEYTQKTNPTWASSLGDMRYNTKWPDLSFEAIDARQAHRQTLLKQLDAIDVDNLDAADQLNYRLFRAELVDDIEQFQFRQFLIPLNQRGGIQTANGITSRLRFNSIQHYSDWIERLKGFGVYMDQTLALMSQGIKEGMVHPRIIMERIPDQINAQLTDDPQDSPFYEPFKKRPDGISENNFAELQQQGLDAISAVVIPAYQRMQTFIQDDYLPASRTTHGIWDTPRGTEHYAMRARSYTTTDLTPDEIHEIGRSEVARIRAQMQIIIDELEFDGSFADFLTFLRSDPQFYHTTPEALLADYRATSKRIDPELVKLFSDLPRVPYGVIPIPDAIAPDTTTAYYSSPAADGTRAGYYYVNLYRPEVRPKYEIEVLTVHEAMPGHHLQIALAQELGELPKFRRFGGYTAFVEGWGLYSESLGEALGLYQDPYSKFGQLTYEMWRAVRLVVDTGIHHKKWTRQEAIDFFSANAAKAEYDIINEIDRYIAWPGQALAYKIGELKIKELRAKSEQLLGEKFDIRAFHKVVLGSGAIPLSELESNVNTWIDQQN